MITYGLGGNKHGRFVDDLAELLTVVRGTAVDQTAMDMSVAAAFSAVMEKVLPGDLVANGQMERGEPVRP